MDGKTSERIDPVRFHQGYENILDESSRLSTSCAAADNKNFRAAEMGVVILLC